MNEGGHGGQGPTASAPFDPAAELAALRDRVVHASEPRERAEDEVAPGGPTRFACGHGHGGEQALRVECKWRVLGGATPQLSFAQVRVGPWVHRYTWAEGEDSAEAEDRIREFLDLVGAVIFGDVEVEELVGRGATAWVMKVRGPMGDWRRCHRGAAGGWAWCLRLFGPRWPGAQVRRWSMAAPRPEGANRRWARTEATLPWAPWAGAAGFVGGGAAAEPQPIPVDGELDLHRFAPRDVNRLMHAYIDECLDRGITELRIVHGKGKGHMRRTVHAALDKHPAVAGYRLAGHGRGGWGATLVELTPATAD